MNTTATITAYLTDLAGPSSYRVTLCTPDGVTRSRTGTLTQCTDYARTKAMEHNVLVRFTDDD
jgi:hypothetical protein